MNEFSIPTNVGFHNQDAHAIARLRKAGTYKDLSTVIICPTLGKIHCRIVAPWLGLIKPMNQKVLGPLFVQGLEVGAAYQTGFEAILQHPELSKWKYVLTLEDDNAPPPDGLMKLYESIDGGVDGRKYDSVCGLYWTKGEAGQPMIYGDPKEPINFRPQIPLPDTVQECHGTGMGFTLMRLSMFTSGKIEKPWFKTAQEPTGLYTQDLYFYEKARKAGFRIASDTRVKVGHFDEETQTFW